MDEKMGKKGGNSVEIGKARLQLLGELVLDDDDQAGLWRVYNGRVVGQAWLISVLSSSLLVAETRENNWD